MNTGIQDLVLAGVVIWEGWDIAAEVMIVVDRWAHLQVGGTVKVRDIQDLVIMPATGADTGRKIMEEVLIGLIRTRGMKETEDIIEATIPKDTGKVNAIVATRETPGMIGNMAIKAAKAISEAVAIGKTGTPGMIETPDKTKADTAVAVGEIRKTPGTIVTAGTRAMGTIGNKVSVE